MEFYNTETFVNHDKSRKFIICEQQDGHLMMTWQHRETSQSSFWIDTFSPGIRHKVHLEDLKHIFEVCIRERPRYSISAIINGLEFYIHLNSPGESRYITFRKFDRKITVEFKTIGMYIDKSDPNFWVERDYVWEVGNEHKLTCKDLYRIKKMCNISDIE